MYTDIDVGGRYAVNDCWFGGRRACVRRRARTLGLVAHVVAEVGPVEGLLVHEGVVHLPKDSEDGKSVT